MRLTVRHISKNAHAPITVKDGASRLLWYAPPFVTNNDGGLRLSRPAPDAQADGAARLGLDG